MRFNATLLKFFLLLLSSTFAAATLQADTLSEIVPPKEGQVVGMVDLSIISTEAGKAGSKWKLTWNDEFNYVGLPDTAKWGYAVGGHGWGNNELQYYTDARIENAVVKNGVLTINAIKENYAGMGYTSTRLISAGKGDFFYGRLEIRARLPKGRGTWPAIWMMPSDWHFGGEGVWPDIGEIDIMEHVGYDPGVIHASAHSKAYQWRNGNQKTGIIDIPDATDAFHTYAFEWDHEVMRAYVDEQMYFEYYNEGLGVDQWPYDKPFYLILNIAVGGDWGGVQGVDESIFPQSMEVDFVRFYKVIEE